MALHLLCDTSFVVVLKPCALTNLKAFPATDQMADQSHGLPKFPLPDDRLKKLKGSEKKKYCEWGTSINANGLELSRATTAAHRAFERSTDPVAVAERWKQTWKARLQLSRDVYSHA